MLEPFLVSNVDTSSFVVMDPVVIPEEYHKNLWDFFPVVSDQICCTNNLDHFLDVYNDYVPLWNPNGVHYLCGVRSQFNLCGWRSMLSGGPDHVFGAGVWDFNSHFLLDGVCHGFKLVDPGALIDGYFNYNYKSATVSARTEIDEIIHDELRSGKLCIVETQPHCIHALGAVLKTSGKYRPITDASLPEGESINCYMNQTFRSFSYNSIDTVSDEMTSGCFMGVTDITSAYRTVAVRPSDRTFQGLVWPINSQDQYIQDNFLSFGTRVAPYIFNAITDSVSRYVQAHGYFCVNYLDDFLVMGATFDACREAQLFLHSVLRSLGFYISYNKVRSPSRVQRYLGVELDSIEMELRLPEDKLSKLTVELEFFAGRRRATKKQLQRLCGILGHCSTLVRGGRTFSHRVIGMLSGFTATKRYVNLSKNFQLDLLWWSEFARWFNGSAKIIQPPLHTSMVTTDASGSGFGAFSGIDWIGGQWEQDLVLDMDKHQHCKPVPKMIIPKDINVRELYPVLESLWRWGHLWRDHKVQCVTDNTQVVAALNSGKAGNDSAMSILRLIFWQTVLYNCHLVGVYLPGRDNVIADAISRVSMESDIPIFLCCRRDQEKAPVRLPCSRATVAGLGA